MFEELGKILLIVFALYAPIKVENMILGGGIIRSGGNTKIIMVIDIVGTWCIGSPLCLLAAYVFKWEIVGVYTPPKRYSGWLYRLSFLRGASG